MNEKKHSKKMAPSLTNRNYNDNVRFCPATKSLNVSRAILENIS